MEIDSVEVRPISDGLGSEWRRLQSLLEALLVGVLLDNFLSLYDSWAIPKGCEQQS